MVTDNLLTDTKEVSEKDKDCGCDTITEKIGAAIPIETAAIWTKVYRKKYPNQIKGHLFGRKIIEEILEQPQCKGIRIYYGIKEDTKPSPWDNLISGIISFLQSLKNNPMEVKQLIVVGADDKLNDQIPQKETLSKEKILINHSELKSMGLEFNNSSYQVADSSLPCPNGCGGGNVLNKS